MDGRSSHLRITSPPSFCPFQRLPAGGPINESDRVVRGKVQPTPVLQDKTETIVCLNPLPRAFIMRSQPAPPFPQAPKRVCAVLILKPTHKATKPLRLSCHIFLSPEQRSQTLSQALAQSTLPCIFPVPPLSNPGDRPRLGTVCERVVVNEGPFSLKRSPAYPGPRNHTYK